MTTQSLKKEGWDYAFFREELPRNRSDGRILLYDNLGWLEGFFINDGLFPNHKLLSKIEKLKGLIEHKPDGFLIKLKKTGETKTLKEAFGLERWEVRNGLLHFAPNCFIRFEHDGNEQVSMVDGEIEAVEVKSDKAHLQSYQRKNYIKIVNNGYALRYFTVKIVSFERNQFDIKERFIKNADEI